MKKTIYTIALLLAAASAAQAQTPKVIKESTEEVTDFLLLPHDLIIYTRKEADGQYLYTEQRGAAGTAQRNTVLNAGAINAVVGTNAAGDELYVYHKKDRKHQEIAVYSWNGTSFQKTGEKPVPSFRNHSYNLGMFLSADQGKLLLSGDLHKTQGYDDVYLSTWQGGEWTKPKGVEGKVNTRQEEFAPFVAHDTLYFSRKQGEQASVLAMPVDQAYKPTGEALALSNRINQEGAFTFAYRKAGEQETWLSKPQGGNSYKFYVAEPDPVVEPAPVAPVVEEAKPVLPQGLALSLQYAFNEVFLPAAERAKLEALLGELPEGTSLVLKGFSDATGPVKGRQRVSRQRAELARQFILRYYPTKNFTIQVENTVLKTKGPVARKTEVHIQK